MRSVGSRALTALITATIATVVATGCAPGTSGLHGVPVGPNGAPAKPSGTLLRYKFAKDQHLRYDCELKLNSEGETWTDEKLHAIVHQLCLGQLENPGGGTGLFKINFVREEVERDKQTKDAEGKKQPPIRLVRNVEPDISTAYGYDHERNLNYFPCDERGNFALAKEARFHRVTYDSLIYLLPVLPAAEVSAGSAWTAEIPVYAGSDYIYGQGGYRGGSDFSLKIAGKVEKIFVRDGSVMAQISWRATGAFDSQGYADRFAASFHARQRLIHEVDAEGRATFDVTRGVVLAKDGRATVTFTSLYKAFRDRGEAKWEKSVTRHRLSYQCRLMPDGAPAAVPASQ